MKIRIVILVCLMTADGAPPAWELGPVARWTAIASADWRDRAR